MVSAIVQLCQAWTDGQFTKHFVFIANCFKPCTLPLASPGTCVPLCYLIFQRLLLMSEKEIVRRGHHRTICTSDCAQNCLAGPKEYYLCLVIHVPPLKVLILPVITNALILFHLKPTGRKCSINRADFIQSI